MGKFVGVSVVLFVLAVGFVALTQGPEMTALIGAYRAEPLSHKIAWAVIVLVPLCMLLLAVWLWDRLVRQRQSANALELRLDGVRARAKELGKVQGDIESEVQRLTRSDPEDAIADLQRRIVESERFAEIQHKRNQMVDLDTRVESLRTHQQALKDRIAPVLETRRSIEQTFTELDSQQSDIQHALAEVATGDDGTALDIRLKNLSEFVRQSNVRCDHIEQASKTVALLSEACAELRARLAPFSAVEDGITSRVRELTEQRDILFANIDSLERTPEGPLADRVQLLADDRKRIDDGIAHLQTQFYKLSGLRNDVASFHSGLDRALNAVSIARNGNAPADIDSRIDELSRFIGHTQDQFDDIESRVMAFGQLRTKLGDLQSRVAPLESDETGVARLIEDLDDIREKLIVKIRRIEGGEEGDLAARVKSFAETKRELEERVASLADQFTKLASIREDIAGLFEKLSSAVAASSH
jgi:chromosome segregation ATPase